eukprot:259797_1
MMWWLTPVAGAVLVPLLMRRYYFPRTHEQPHLLKRFPVLELHRKKSPSLTFGSDEKVEDEDIERVGPFHCSHRGGVSLFGPENTLQTYKRCVELSKTSFLEFDVRHTKDGRMVACHDSTVNRTTNGSGFVSSFTFDEIRKLDAAYKFRVVGDDGQESFPLRGSNYKIPSVEEIIDEFISAKDKFGNPLCFIFDIKQKSVVCEVLALISDRGISDRVVLCALPWGASRELLRLKPHAIPMFASKLMTIITYMAWKIGLLWLMPLPYEMIGISMRRYGLKVYDERFIRDMRNMGILTAVYGPDLDDPTNIRTCLDGGVNFLVGDCPDVLRTEMDRWSAR